MNTKWTKSTTHLSRCQIHGRAGASTGRSAQPTEAGYQGDFAEADFVVNVFPVPASDVLNFEYLCPLSSGNVYIYNAVGTKITEAALPAGLKKVSVPVAALPNGVYTYKVVFDACGTKFGKINIVH